MQPMSDGMNVDPEILNQTLMNRLGQAAVREAQMEAALQMLLQEKQGLLARISELEGVADDSIADDTAVS